jgi:type IV pilus assembly protein PilE
MLRLPGGPDAHFARPTGNEIHAKLCPRPAECKTGLDQAPPFGAPVYRLRALPADEANGGYAVEARPVETGPMCDDQCGTFILDATGLRANRTADGAAAADSDLCWNTR